MPPLCTLLQMSVYTTNTHIYTSAKHFRITHNVEPIQSGKSWLCLRLLAFPELLVAPLELEELQPAELRVLTAALVSSEEDPGPLFCATVKQDLVPEALRMH